MNLTTRVPAKALTFAAACLAFLLPSASSAAAQNLSPRITAPIVNTSRVTLAGSHPTAANPAADLGTLDPATRLQGITVVFSRSSAQQAALDSIVAAQQDPKSSQFHQWLTPDQFAAKFGVADSDIAATQTWLQSQGFTLGEVSRSRTRITFSGTEAQVEQAFKTQLHNFRAARAAGGMFFAPATDLSIPAALAGTVMAVENLSSYRPHSHLVARKPQPDFTVSQNQAYYLLPPDVATIYDINPVYSAGFTGTGQTIAVVGQSAVYTSDITTFQTALGVAPKAPNTYLVPGTGTSTLYSGDEGESDLDLEYTGAMAPGATINFYYTGSSQTAGVFDSIQYVVDNNAANIISSSYGDCEFDIGQSNIAIIDSILQQGVAQGETIINAAGDNGSTDCAENTTLTFAEQTALAVDYPGSSPYVTAAGGTEFSAADTTPLNTTYWTSAGNSDVISTAIKYIPEQVWNDDVFDLQYAGSGQSPLSSTGGGASLYESRPTWQTGVPGIASGSARLTPDISLAASPNFPGYVFCTSDTTYYGTQQSGSCVVGFRDATQGYINAAGGTSFVAPILSGLVAIINQAKGYTTGQGLINPTLYTLAANSATYAAAFHDITSGSNACQAGPTYCGTGPQTTDFVTTPGYDEATGLGSIDFNKLLTAWPTSGGGVVTAGDPTTTTLTAATTTPIVGASDVITVGVISTDNIAVGGTITLTVDGVTTPTPITAPSGTYTFSSTTTGAHNITATYSGDGTHAASSATLVLNVISGTFVVTATNVTVASGSSANSTITVTPSGGYTGTVGLTLAIPAGSTLTDVCVTDTNNGFITITGAAAGTDVVTVYTSEAACSGLGLSTLASPGKGGARILPIVRRSASVKLSSSTPRRSPWKQLPLPTAMAGMVLLFGLRRRANRNVLRIGLSLVVVAMLSVSGLGLTACSSSAKAPTSVLDAGDTPAGTYAVQIIGQDSVTLQTSTANVTLTVQ